ncbi:hypothetical protein [Thiothrix nivea]|uniref:DUF2281 domain-containing protein n=1 Tax=Thiothrix nivea (strain ATCC 35100 / DSM 5205 / JP2) TaxID=870187 RepID=A0A656HEU8_THINJ|nr:hypothetical protein [Thiothrix nivea]EIJ35448.1 hypothetical protein Thini_2919 [Thiothrix nivea DSM 5205]
MQTFDQIVNQTRNLPESTQREILHFVEFIVTRYRTVPKPAQETTPDAFAIYQSLDLGQGGYAKAPSNRAKQGIRELLLKKHLVHGR